VSDLESSTARARGGRLWRRLMARRRNRRMSAHELRELRDAVTRVPRRQLQIFLGLIDMQMQRLPLRAERRRLQQLRCHVAARMIVEKHSSQGHLPGGVKLEVVLAEICRCISDGYKTMAPDNDLYWRLGPVDIDREGALAVALLLSESLAEAMALPTDQPYRRRIDVALTRLDAAEAELSIKDNTMEGDGLAQAVLQDNPLPQRLAQRCRGTLRINGAPNFHLLLTFPLDHGRQR
jgi:hypothetical protein